MENADFEKQLAECKETLEKLSKESRKLSERLCGLIEEHDGEQGEWYWACRTMNSDIDDVLEDTTKRLERYRAGDRPELPQVLIMAIECCERLQATAELVRQGRQDERRDLRGQISSNIGYLEHHMRSMDEDGFLPDDVPAFEEFHEIAGKAIDGSAETEELVKFICTKLDPVHTFLNDLRRNVFWEVEQ